MAPIPFAERSAGEINFPHGIFPQLTRQYSSHSAKNTHNASAKYRSGSSVSRFVDAAAIGRARWFPAVHSVGRGKLHGLRTVRAVRCHCGSQFAVRSSHRNRKHQHIEKHARSYRNISHRNIIISDSKIGGCCCAWRCPQIVVRIRVRVFLSYLRVCVFHEHDEYR